MVLGQITWLHCCCTLTTVHRALRLGRSSGYLVEWFKVECRLCSLLLVWLSGFWQAVCTGWWVFFGTTVVLGLGTWLHYCCTLTTVHRAL